MFISIKPLIFIKITISQTTCETCADFNKNILIRSLQLNNNNTVIKTARWIF